MREMQKYPNPKHPENPGHDEKTKLIIGIDENEDFQIKGKMRNIHLKT